MAIARSKVTSQGQISVPVDVRRKLGIHPGSILEWEQDGDKMVVRRVGRYSSEDIHRALFGACPPKTRSLDELRSEEHTSQLHSNLTSFRSRERDAHNMCVRGVGRYSSEDIHRALFGACPPKTRSLDELRDGIRRYARRRYARG